MNKFYKILLILFMLSVSFSFMANNNSTIAGDYYSFDCGDQYEVSWITDDGKFSKHSCHADFVSAKNQMKNLGGDHVVRHNSSPSPTRIVAMNNGNAYSYPARDGKDTMNIYESKSLAQQDPYVYKRTYIANHYELNYIETINYFPSVKGGIAKVSMNGFDGYVDVEFTDLVPDKFIDRGLPIFLGGNDKTVSNEQPFSVIIRRNYYTVQEKDGRRELIFVYHRGYCKPENTNKLDIENVLVIGPAPDELATGVKYYSTNGYDFYTSPSYGNKAVTYYPYYQFLPLRTKTNLSAENLNEAFVKIKNSGSSALRDNGYLFIEAQEKYGVNALLLYAMAAHESGWGTSHYALERNNLFGWNAVDADPNQASHYKSLRDGIMQHAGRNLRGYLDITDFRFFSSSLGNKGSGLNVYYASDPYWSMKIASIAYQIDKVNSANGELNDFNRYQLYLVDEFDAKFYQGPSTDSKVMYTGQYGTYYQKDLIAVKLSQDGNMTKVQSTNPIVNGDIIRYGDTKNSLIEYNFNDSYVYLKTDILKPLNHVLDENIPTPQGDYIGTINSFNWDGNLLYIAGKAYVPGITIDGNNTITNKLNIYNDKTNKEFNLDSILNDDGSVDYKASVDLSGLQEGIYYFKINTYYSKYGQFNNSFNIRVNSIPETKIFGNFKYMYGLSNGLTTVNKTKYDKDAFESISALNSLDLDENYQLNIDGLAFVSGANYVEPTSISHTLEVVDILSKKVVKETKLDTYEVYGIGINDGFKYSYIGYKGSIDLSDLTLGSYLLRVRVINGDINESIVVNTTDSKYLLNIKNKDNLIYKISTNQLYNYRLEIDIEHNSIDYSKINKESIRDSVASFENFEIVENKLVFSGVAYINKLNFSSENNPKYNLYLVSDSGDKYDINLNTVACKFDYGSILNSGYNLTSACFEGEYDITQLPIGDYKLYLEIAVVSDEVTYFDVFNLTNRQNTKYKEVTIKNKIYSPYVSKDRFRMHINVSDVNVEG